MILYKLKIDKYGPWNIRLENGSFGPWIFMFYNFGPYVINTNPKFLNKPTGSKKYTKPKKNLHGPTLNSPTSFLPQPDPTKINYPSQTI